MLPDRFPASSHVDAIDDGLETQIEVYLDGGQAPVISQQGNTVVAALAQVPGHGAAGNQTEFAAAVSRGADDIIDCRGWRLCGGTRGKGGGDDAATVFDDVRTLSPFGFTQESVEALSVPIVEVDD